MSEIPEYIRRIEGLQQALEEIATGKVVEGSAKESWQVARRIAKEALEGDAP